MSTDSTTTNGHTDSYAKTEIIKEIGGNSSAINEKEDQEWTPLSWKSKPIRQDVVYEDQEHLQRVLNKLQHLPPMVTPSEVFYIKSNLLIYKKKNIFYGK